MIPTIAWRNVWRSVTRSMVVIGAIALGVWAAIFMSGFATGMVRSYVSNAVENIISHIQVHHPEFKEDNDVKYFIKDIGQVNSTIQKHPEVEALTVRSLSNGMISSPQSARGVMIKAVEAEAEAKVTGMNQKIVEGEYFSESRGNQILVSKTLAEKLKVKHRTKVVLTFQDMKGDITAGAFRIKGIFKSGNKPFDETHVFVLREDLNRLLAPANGDTASDPALTAQEVLPGLDDYGHLAHEIAILLKDPQKVESVRDSLQQQLGELKVETYRQISPDLELYESQIKSVSIIYLTIIMLALVFGIVNTMLMAVLERMKELGMLMAIGMNKTRIFLMIMLEAVILGVVAAPAGLLLGHFTVVYFRNNGLDLSAYSETLQEYGMSDIIYFDLDPVVYWQVPVAVAITAILAAIYPAWKAIRLRPVEAIRKI